MFLMATGAAVAQLKVNPPPIPPNERDVYLVRLDQSDCYNSNVPNTDGPNVTGYVQVIRGTDGTTQVKVALTGTPNTNYQFYLKCKRQIGSVQTGDEGVGTGLFTFQTNEIGNTFAFDSYPTGAPAGNKFQSASVKF